MTCIPSWNISTRTKAAASVPCGCAPRRTISRLV